MGEMSSRKRIFIYSDDSALRDAIVAALGRRVSADLPEHDIEEFATGAALRARLDGKNPTSKPDLIILDGEAVPEGGMGISRQLKDEIFECPPVLLITARPDDAWLAAWSRAEATFLAPIDPFTFAHTAAELMRLRAVAEPHLATH